VQSIFGVVSGSIGLLVGVAFALLALWALGILGALGKALVKAIERWWPVPRHRHKALEAELVTVRQQATDDYQALQRTSTIQILDHRLMLVNAQQGPNIERAIENIPDGDLAEIRTHAPHHAKSVLQAWIGSVSSILSQGGRPDLVEQLQFNYDDEDLRSKAGLRAAYDRRRELLQDRMYESFWKVDE
jgi:hypothetical protein